MQDTKSLSRLFIVFFLISAPAIAGKVWVVAPDFTGHFTQIQHAVDAAAPGDTILVKSGSYSSFIVIDKQLSIVGDAWANVLVDGAIRVRSLGKIRT